MSITLVQNQTTAPYTSNYSISTSATGAGNLLLLVVAQNTITAAPSGWSRIYNPSTNVDVWWYPNNPGGLSSFTFSITTSGAGGYSFQEWSGVPSSIAVDLSVWNSNTGSTITVTSGSAPAASGELMVGLYMTFNSTSQTTPSGWTLIGSDNYGDDWWYWNLTTASAPSVTYTGNASGGQQGIILTFKSATTTIWPPSPPTRTPRRLAALRRGALRFPTRVPSQKFVPQTERPALSRNRFTPPQPRGRRTQFLRLPSQVRVPEPPKIQRRWHALIRRGRQVTPIPPQQQVVVQTWAPQPPTAQGRRAALLRRGSARFPTQVPPQAYVPPALNPSTGRRLLAAVRRGSHRYPTQVPPQVWVPQPVAPSTARRVLSAFRRGHSTAPQPTVPPTPPVKTSAPRRVAGWIVQRGRTLLPGAWSQPTPPVQRPVKWSAGSHQPRWRSGLPSQRWQAGTMSTRWSAGTSPSQRWEAGAPQSRWKVTSVALTIPGDSLQYVRVPISATVSGATYNPTSDTVKMAFTTTYVEPSTWYTGSWETAGTTYYALCLIGPSGTVTLTPGTYYVWVQVTDNPEVPVLPAGQLVVNP